MTSKADTRAVLKRVADDLKEIDIVKLARLVVLALARMPIDERVAFVEQVCGLMRDTALVTSRSTQQAAERTCKRADIDATVDAIVRLVDASVFFHTVGGLVTEAHREELDESDVGVFDNSDVPALKSHAEEVRTQLILAVTKREMAADRKATR